MKKLITITAILFSFFASAQKIAVIKNGEIKVFNQYPKTWVDTSGVKIENYDKIGTLKHYRDGFRPIQRQRYNKLTHTTCCIYFDVANDVFKLKIIKR